MPETGIFNECVISDFIKCEILQADAHEQKSAQGMGLSCRDDAHAVGQL